MPTLYDGLFPEGTLLTAPTRRPRAAPRDAGQAEPADETVPPA